MIDIVRVFEKFANDKDFLFDFGNRPTLNLIGGTSSLEVDLCKIYLLLENRVGTSKINNFGTLEGVNYKGMFMLLVCSDFDMINFNKINKSKYNNNIEPLLVYYNNFIQTFGCTDLKINSISFQDLINVLDQNFDGILVNFDIFIPVGYEL